jgi:thiol-disulfide isomerase/thioredoxin
MLWRFSLSALALLLALVFLWSKAQETPAPPAETSALQTLLRLTLADAKQTPIDLAAWQGQVRVINFWATWCAPCMEEMPAFSRLQDEFREKDVQFVGIALDTPANVQAFSEKYPVSYPLPIGNDQVLALTRALGNPHMSLPFTLIVSREGKILARKTGRLEAADLAALLSSPAQK